MFKIGSTYNIPTRAPAILGATYKQVVLKGIVDYESAIAISNIELLHRQIYPILPIGTPDNPRQYNWYHFKTTNGTSFVLAHVWIDIDNVDEIINKVGIFTVPSITDADAVRILNQLRAMGYAAFSEIKDVVQ